MYIPKRGSLRAKAVPPNQEICFEDVHEVFLLKPSSATAFVTSAKISHDGDNIFPTPSITFELNTYAIS